ncbi:hypothetical protein BH09BAC1_BH09BAC1_00820 [soil metagenome]
MVICHGKKFIFIHNYKVAGTSVREALQVYTIRPLESYTNWIGQKLHVLPQSSDFPDHITAPELKQQLAPKYFDNYYKFGFTRNPWDWQVSLYHFAIKDVTHGQHELTKKMSFAEYLQWRVNEDKHPQKEFMYDAQGNSLMDFIGKLETIEEDFKKITTHLGITATLPHSNKSNHQQYREYYTPELKELVAQHFKEDIELFGYEF